MRKEERETLTPTENRRMNEEGRIGHGYASHGYASHELLQRIKIAHKPLRTSKSNESFFNASFCVWS